MLKIFTIKICMLLVFFYHFTNEIKAQISMQDSLALIALYDSTNGATWTDNTNWKTNNSVDTWFGITISNGMVTEISLGSNNLTGVIPVEIGNLDSLSTLNLYSNQLSGNIPVGIGNLTNLTFLHLANNQLTDSIPNSIGNLVNLSAMYLQSNQLTGSIPEALGGLTNFQYLYLYGNQLTGVIPDSLGNLINLRQIYLNNNQLTGSIPDALGNLTNLMEMNLYHNQITDTIPDALGALTNLLDLSLSSNQLTGTIPDTLRNLANLVNLGLRSNQLTGIIPDALGNLTNLRYLYLYSNQLTGIIPDTLGNLTELRHLRLDNNRLTGNIPAVLTNLTNITNLHLAHNQLSGAVPPEIVNITSLSYFAINNNQFEDFPDLGVLNSLNNLTIQDNYFTFEDIEPNVGVPSSTFTYSPQDSVGSSLDTTLNANDYLEMSIQVGGTANQYQWVKDGTDITNATDSIYIISPASIADSGSYHCRITNTIATDLTLYSRPVYVDVFDPTDISETTSVLPQRYELYQNYPNPFNPTTSIKFDLPEAAKVKIEILNVLGQNVTTILDSKKSAGQYEVIFDATHLSSGIYFYRIESGNFQQIKKMAFLK